MSEEKQGTTWGKRLLGVVGVAALALGMVATVPTAANAAGTKSISGTISAPKGQKVGAKYGQLGLLKSNCKWAGDYQVSWNGKKYTVKGLEAGNYKVVYYPNYYKPSNKVPYGMGTAWTGGGLTCESAKTVKTGTKKANISVKANGKVQITGASVKYGNSYNDEIVFYDAKSNKPAGSAWGDSGARASLNTAPGKYRVALERTTWKGGKVKTKVLKVAGTKSKSVKKGKIVTVKAGKAIVLKFSTGKATAVKDFSYKAAGKVTGTPKVGKTLTAKVSKMPKGTKLKYQWYSDGKKIKGATKKTYKVKKSDLTKGISAQITATKKGYNVGYFYGYKYVKGAKLTQKTAQRIDETQKDTQLKANAATFTAGTVSKYYDWYVNGEWIMSGSTLSSDYYYPGATVELHGYYSKKGYESVTKKTTFVVPGESAPGAEATGVEEQADPAPAPEEPVNEVPDVTSPDPVEPETEEPEESGSVESDAGKTEDEAEVQQELAPATAP